METLWLAWAGVLAYFAITAALALWGYLHTTSLAGYAVGGRDIPAFAAGCAIAVQLTSVGTFLINPGLVYEYGFSALIGYGVCGGLGIITGYVMFSRRFRRHSAIVEALTIPHWIGSRYSSPHLRAAFAVLSFALLTKSTLIVVALALMLSELLRLPPHHIAVALTTAVVGSVMVGGAIGHAWANVVHAISMITVALIVIGAGLPLVFEEPGVATRLAAIDPRLVRPINPTSLYFRSFFEVFVCYFVIGMAVVCQPHVLSKALYLRDEGEVRKFQAMAGGCAVIFTSVLVIGVWARLTLPPGLPIDRVVPAWLIATFPPPMQVLLAIGLLSAGLSTLEGILLALSVTISADLYPLIARKASEKSARRAGRFGLLALGVATATLALWQIDQPTGRTVTIFAQYGTYMILSASLPPLVCGMFLPQIDLKGVTAGVVTALAVYLTMAFLKISTFHNNPAFLATMAIAAAGAVVVLQFLFRRGKTAAADGVPPNVAVPHANR